MTASSDQPGLHSSPRVMIVAGEASGDRNGAALYQALRKRYDSFDCIAMGGIAMREAGVSIVIDSTNFGVIGIWDVVAHYIPIRMALSRIYYELKTFSPDLLICIDYKEFNFLVAKRAKLLGIKVLFFVSPQVWAWRPGRARHYGKVVDMMAVIFPFEVDYYQRYSIPVRYVGHPLSRAVKVSVSRQQALSESGLGLSFPVIGLLPGSRAHEVKRLLPVMLEVAESLLSVYPQAQFILPRASNINDQVIKRHLMKCPVPIYQCRASDYNLLQCCNIAITASGTATLELALLSIPMVIVYKMAPLTYWLAKRLVCIPYIGLPNIISGRIIVPELIQKRANPTAIFNAVCKILENRYLADQMRQDMSGLSVELGDLDAVETLADLAGDMLHLE